ncbi:MAG: phosphoribosylanthranilate isomerase [Candidatus Eisenbacteria bacterium]
MIRIKICCIESAEEASLAVRAGASALGLVSEMPSGPGVIDDDRIREIAAGVPGFVVPVLLTSRTEADRIAEQAESCGVRAVQLCAPVAPSELDRLRKMLPGVARIAVVHVSGPESALEAQALAGHVEGLLLDTGTRVGPEIQLGGTGRTHDWSVSRRIVEDVAVPVVLAGGLRPENVGDAIRTVRPWAVDVCGGVRSPSGSAPGGHLRLDGARLDAFVRAVREGAEGSA